MYGFFYPFAVTLTDKVRDDNVRAYRDAREQAEYQGDNGRVAAYRRHCVLSDESPDDRDVCGVEELLQYTCCCKRQRKLHQLVADRAVQHINIVFHFHHQGSVSYSHIILLVGLCVKYE